MTNTVTIGVASRDDINARFMRAMTTGKRVGRDEAGFRFPYDAVQVDFVLKAA